MSATVGTAPARGRTTSLARWEALLVALLVAVIAYGSVSSDVFLETSNFRLIVSNFIERAIMALPMTLIIIAGEIDLSVASILGLTSATMGVAWDAGWPLWAAILAALVVGLVCGLFNGFFITKVALPSLVVTLGTLALFRGLCSVILGPEAVSDYPKAFQDFGFQSIPGTSIPWTLLVFLTLLAIFAPLLHATRFGRYIYAIGTNDVAARFSAVRVDRIKLALYAASGFVAAIAGICFTARFSSSRSDNGVGFELDVIAAVLLGGVSIFGGKGTMLGVVLALAVVATLRNALALNDVGGETQSIAIGLLLILSVLGPNIARRLRHG